MTELPEPLTPPDCDLRGMEWMPLHGHKLYGSDFDAIASDAEYRAAQRLWWSAWQQQVPAASLPDDDRVLAHVAGYQRDPKGWAKVRDVALHAFIKCSDGRLYHRFLAPEAVIAWEKRVKERERKAQYRAKKDGNTGGQDGVVPRDKTGTASSHDEDANRDVRVDRTTQDRTGQFKKEKERTEAIASDAAASLDASLDARTRFFREGLALMAHMTGKPPDKCRAFMGKILKDLDDDCNVAFGIVQDAAENRPIDPIAWIAGAVIERKKPPSTAIQRAAAILGVDLDRNSNAMPVGRVLQ